jgi:tetratricopeptide (TPR) repeat protein
MLLRYLVVVVVAIVIAVILAFRTFSKRRNETKDRRMRGVPHEGEADHDNAVADITAAFYSNPADASSFETRGFAWLEKGEHDKAVSDFTEAIRLDPQNASNYYNRGLALVEKGDYDGAIADFTEAIHVDPNQADSYLCRGNVWSQKGEHDKAIADFTEAIKLDPEDTLPFYNRGNAAADKGDFEGAISDYTEAIRGDPKNAAAHFNRGLAWDRKGGHEKAVADFDAAIRLDSELGLAHSYRTRAWLMASGEGVVSVKMRFPGQRTRITEDDQWLSFPSRPPEPGDGAPIPIRVRPLGGEHYRLEDPRIGNYGVECAQFKDVITADQLPDGTLRFRLVSEPGQWHINSWILGPPATRSGRLNLVFERAAAEGGFACEDPWVGGVSGCSCRPNRNMNRGLMSRLAWEAGPKLNNGLASQRSSDVRGIRSGAAWLATLVGIGLRHF